MRAVCAFLAATSIKLLLLPAYHSTDCEGHRPWRALTSRRPLSGWYVDTTAEWTLDCPPLFAWFERAVGLGATLVDERMLVMSAEPYASETTVAYQRSTVVATDLVLLLGAHRMARGQPEAARLVPVALVVCNAGLLLVDHVHFQYNGALVGLLLLSLAALGVVVGPLALTAHRAYRNRHELQTLTTSTSSEMKHEQEGDLRPVKA